MLVEIEVLVDTEKSETHDDQEDVELEIVGAENEEEIEKPKREETYDKVTINPDYIAGIQEKFGQGVLQMESLYYPKFVLARDSREKVTQQINEQVRNL